MQTIQLKLMDREGTTLVRSECAAVTTYMLLDRTYEEGDQICLEVDKPNTFVEVSFDDAIRPALLYVTTNTVTLTIPFGEKRTAISPKAFQGNIHYVSARVVEDFEAYGRRNLALNPVDGFLSGGVYPHAHANIETRGEAVFAARNAIDGIFANHSHGMFPYGSWGINRRADAAWTLELGQPCVVDAMRLTLRADFPHDNYWVSATMVFSDGSHMEMHLEKTSQPQLMTFEPKTIESVTLQELIQSDLPSPFPALTQVELFGTVVHA